MGVERFRGIKIKGEIESKKEGLRVTFYAVRLTNYALRFPAQILFTTPHPQAYAPYQKCNLR